MMIRRATKIISALFPIVFLLGLIVNILSFVIFSRKKFKKTLFSVYFRLLNIVYSLTLGSSVIDFLNYEFDQNVQSTSTVACKAMFCLFFSIAPIGGWLLVIISLDRFLDINFSEARLKHLKNKTKFQVGVSAFLIFYNLSYYLNLIFEAEN